MAPLRLYLAVAVATLGLSVLAAPLPKLKVGDNRRFVVTQDSQPFFWLGDTAWGLSHPLNRAQAEQSLDNRAQNGFILVQAVAIAELDGHTDPNACGGLPLVELEPVRPAVQDGPDNDYWEHVDFIVDAAHRRGSSAMVDVAVGRKFKVRMDRISGSKVKARWGNPRAGGATATGEFPNTSEREFLSPNSGEQLDWVLGPDDAVKRFPPPGARP